MPYYKILKTKLSYFFFSLTGSDIWTRLATQLFTPSEVLLLEKDTKRSCAGRLLQDSVQVMFNIAMFDAHSSIAQLYFNQETLNQKKLQHTVDL